MADRRPRAEQRRVVGNIDTLLTQFDDLDLRVTAGLRHVADLRDLSERLVAREGGELDEGEAAELSDLMHAIRATIDSELGGVSAFVVSDKRWTSDKLLHNIGLLFRPGTLEALPEIARTDFEEAGKCVAFERPTAAAFHLMRGTEACLRMCYEVFVVRDRLPPERRMWGPMVTQMRERTRRPPESLLSNLDNIRVSYRNPTQHPDAVYDIHMAQDLFGLCIDVVNQMCQAASASR